MNAHRNDPSILRHRGSGILLVTWAEVADDVIRWGVERYLVESLRPVASQQHRSVPIVEVNLPA